MPTTSRLATAFEHAREVHAGQTRKGNDVPYISHVMAVSALVLEAGGTEDEAIAALLHDTLEDGGDPDRERAYITEHFGPHVLDIVVALSDAEPRAGEEKPPWRQRKVAYIEHLAHTSDLSTLLVGLADKFHNLSATLRDLDADGDATWARFNAGPEDQLWYYVELDRAFAGSPIAGSPLQVRYAAAVADLRTRMPKAPARVRTASTSLDRPVVGVDGCRTGWVAASPAPDGGVILEVFPDIAALATAFRDRGDAIIAIDVPIGLPERTTLRGCDQEARALLKDPAKERARFTSVFAPPDRELVSQLDFTDVQEIVAVRKAADPKAKGISKQAFAIAPKIREIDTFLRAQPEAREWLIEVHPEVCFREMSGAAGGLLRKKAAAGREERIALLRRSLAAVGITVPDPIPSMSGVARDDILDALAALWTAFRIRSGEARRLGGEVDAMGIPMQMLA